MGALLTWTQPFQCEKKAISVMTLSRRSTFELKKEKCSSQREMYL